MTTNGSPFINEAVLQALVEKALVDFGATWNAGLIIVGDRVGLYEALDASDAPLTSVELAARTATAERYVREWLRAQAAGGYITYHPETDGYSMTPEQASLMAHEDSPVFMAGGFHAAVGALRAVPKLIDAFRSGDGIGWHEHDPALFEGTERFYRASYLHHLTTDWIPALDGVEAKLHAGGRVADVGCGHGASTIIMAQAYPDASFVGYDYHEESIVAARERAQAGGVADRVRFETASAKTFNGAGYDLITTFDAFHDLGDPAGAASHIRDMLTPEGTWMLVEPRAGDRVEDNLNPLGRVFYAASTMVCTGCSLDQEVGAALGAQAGEARLHRVITGSGFTRFRRATETPFHFVLEARI
ncbi:MAG: class I SAM-dependent methyltransferase [Gemmatimonadales bacterium]|jgi:2-polyprenyl-3-methyl-5-hydroxy-6-metoxy-1,4-benzoquinol methylase